jgi:hypothetical protein
MLKKWVDYSYPSSPRAVSLGYSNTGCYVVKIQQGIELARVVYASASARDAYRYAMDIGIPWDASFLRLMSDVLREAANETT